MKKIILPFFAVLAALSGCNNKEASTTGSSTSSASSVTLPYVAGYTTEFTNDVSDSDLLLVLNSYKYWEAGDIKALRATMGDSMAVDGAEGFKYNGLTDSLIGMWQKSRDSLSSVVIKMDVWLKNHSVKDSADYVNVWYKEIDTYKTGRVDSANYSDVNAIKNGKIVWYSSFKQKIK